MYDINFFREEVDLIKDPDLAAMTELALADAPKWFWSSPVSITGKHHPPDDLVQGGLCIHSKKVAWLGHRFFGAFNLDTDIGTSSGLLHDIRRYGESDEIGGMDEYSIHAKSAADWLREFGNEQFSYGAKCREKWGKVCFCVQMHMGKWENGIPVMLEAQLLHLADIAASFRLLVGLPFYTDDVPPLPDIMEAGKRLVVRNGKTLINFGKKHFRKDVMDVMATDPGYFDWMLKAGFPDDVCEQVRAIKAEYTAMMERQRELEAGQLPF